MSDSYGLQRNSSTSKPRITVGLDIGTTKIAALVASVEQDSPTLKILGIGIAESEGLNRGVVVNIEKTTKAIKNVISQAEQQSGIKITDVNIGIAGDHIESAQSRGIITISNATNEISQQDVDRLLDEARKIIIPSDRQILHVLPQDFIIDGQDGIQDPVGMSGLRLEANVHIITGLKTAIQNITRCVERAGLRIKNLVLEPLAAAKAVLSEEEKEIGVAIVDIGGGTTDVAVFANKIIRYTSVFGIAGNQITSDLQQGLGITLATAEKVKRENGHAYSHSIIHDEPIMIPSIPGRKPQEISKQLLCEILQPRMEEILNIVKAEFMNSGYYDRIRNGGIVITGGSTLLRGTDQLAQEVLEMEVKIGIPTGITYAGLGPEIESPVYATAVGLAKWGAEDADEIQIPERIEKEVKEVKPVKRITTSVNQYNTQDKVTSTSVPTFEQQTNIQKEKTEPKIRSWFDKVKERIKDL